MNIEAYDADSLRKMVRLLDYENKILKDKLKKAGISYEEVNPFEEKIESAEEYDLDQGNRIVNPPYITEKMAIRFFSMFWGREDVYARRGKNGGYFPQCANRWNDRLCPKQRKEKVFCDECENTKYMIPAINALGIFVLICATDCPASIVHPIKVCMNDAASWKNDLQSERSTSDCTA